MKKNIILILSIIFFSITIPVKALTSTELKGRTTCSKFELAIAKSDKSIKSVKCYNTYNEAKSAMNADKSSDNLIILERRNSVTSVVDARRALVYLGVKSIDTNTSYYSDSSLKNYIGYMNHHSNYGATDGVFLEFNSSKHSAKVMSNGVTGWISDGSYKVVPIEWLGKYSYYQVTSTELKHFYAANIETSYTQGSRVIDKKPSMLAVGTYYSFDGKYFYTKLADLINDYKSNSRSKSVNANNPYYNYYMFLPHRARSNYTADDIDSYLKNTKGYIGTIYGKKLVDKYSNMYGTGIFFKSSESLYGANAIMMMSLATNESAWGRSSIAINKNNLFGHAAYDSSAYDSATGYLNPYQSIIGHANNYINCGYAKPTDWRYNGSNFGNKKSGMNVEYASDPYWGEKAANYYYEFEKVNGFLDYNYYQLGVTTNTEPLNVRKEPNTTSAIPYKLEHEDIPVIILGEATGTIVNGSSKWYKIAADPNLNSTRTGIVSCSFSTYYNWSGYVYVHSSYIRKINTTTNGKLNSNNDTSKITKNYTYKEYSSKASYTPKAGVVNKDSTVYVTSTLSMSTGKTIKKGHIATVFMEALNENKKVVAYLVTYDYSKNQRGWISADNLTITDKDILKTSLKNAGATITVYKTAGGSSIGSMYTDTYSVIVDKKTYNSNLWLQIYYGIDNTLGWINTNVSSSVGSLSYTTNKLNQKPTITASNKTVFLNQKYDPLNGVSAFDNEDGNLTSSIKVTNNTVDTTKTGTYSVTYEVSDSKGEKVTKTITVTVKDYTLGSSLFIYDDLKYISGNTFEIKGFLAVKKMNNTNVTHKLIFTNTETNKEYTYDLGAYTDYPYDVDSLDDDKEYNYKAGWFKGNVDLSNIPEGDYLISVTAHNHDTGYYTKINFTNLAFKQMARRIKTTNRGYSFDVDYNTKGSPIIMSIRDNGLISYDVPSTDYPMYNSFNEIKISGNTLSITGTSHNYGVSYSKNDKVERQIIFENINNFTRYSYDLSYIDDGPYKVTLAVSDNKDKTRAWYKKDVNLSNLPKGDYVVYIETTSNSKSYYGELRDIAYTNFEKINTSKYQLRRDDSKRLRVELTVK